MTSPPAGELFDRDAENYDLDRRQLIPPFDSLYGAAVEGVALAVPRPRAILDLGAGTGILARRLLAAFPGVRMTLVDGSSAMLEQARTALGGRVSYLHQDLTDELPPGPWDAIVSALAIHHLAHRLQQALFARIHAALVPSGIFVNAEQLAGPTPWLDGVYAAWHERTASQLGVSRERWTATAERMRSDRCASLEDHVRWLRLAGFSDVDCLFRHYRFGVVVARRQEGGQSP